MSEDSCQDRIEFVTGKKVSRETMEKLSAYKSLLIKWQEKINLIGSGSLSHIWDRHICDSAQILQYIPKTIGNSAIYDVGSGAEFPGLVLSILGVSQIKLIESDARKCEFLREISRISESNVEVIRARMPDDAIKIPLPKASILLARGVAPLPKLLDVVFPVLSCSTCCILHKGEKAYEEINRAKIDWEFNFEIKKSKTSVNGKIIILDEVQRHGEENR